MTGGHCLKVWTRKQQVASLSTAESDLYAEVKTASEGLAIQSVAKDLGIVCGLNLTAGCWARQHTSPCRTCGYKEPPSQRGSPRRMWVRT